MTETEILNIISMVEQIAVIVICRYILLFMPYKIYYCLGRSLFHNDHRYIKWLFEHIYYAGYALLSICCLATCIIMASQFSNREMFVKPIAQFYVSPVTWLSILVIIAGHYLWIRGKIKQGVKMDALD